MRRAHSPFAAAALVAALFSAAALGYGCDEHYPDPLGAAAVGSGDASFLDGAVGDGGDPLESVAPAIVDASKRTDVASSVLVYDAARNAVWVANADVGTVSYVELASGKVGAEIVVGTSSTNITSVALSPDGKWIAAVDRIGAQVALIDADARVVRRSLAVGSRPRAAVWDATNPRYLYISQEDDDAVTVIDRTAGVVLRTLPVGEKPAGLAVSRLRNELTVMHRTNGQITVLDLDGTIPGDAPTLTQIPLDVQAANSDPTQPQGAPFAFESIAWMPDGMTAWVPHELITLKQPFQFQQTLFPAVSVVNIAGRAEVETNPNDPNGVVAGRKLLFGAINLLDAMGNTTVVSQPCAVSIAANGQVAYALACASEDLITFDVFSGAAVDILRQLPGDHPTGLALDSAGNRGFVYADQSHTLTTLDLAGQTSIAHVTVASSMVTVAKDPVAPALRAGETIFFSSNSQKNPLPVSGNNWMACGGCHLDGFESGNHGLFDHLVPNLATNAQIGHVGLADLFSTSPTPSAANFNPHDILVAITDQGGLAPDRSGASRTGAVDPSHPTADATAMATSIAQVIARDLPLGPTWLLPNGNGYGNADAGAPNPDHDGAWCGSCHQAEYASWQKSAHSQAGSDSMMKFCAGVEEKTLGKEYGRFCAGCHDPVSMRLGDSSLTTNRGVTCLGCHENVRTIRAGGNGDLQAQSYDWTLDHKARATADLVLLRKPQFCGGCHEQFVPGTGVSAISTLGEWQGSVFATDSAQTTCVDCHMPTGTSGADHAAIGGNVYLATLRGNADVVADTTEKLKSAMSLSATSSAGGVSVVLTNRGAGHSFPTGVTDIREPWVEIQAVNKAGTTLQRYGGPAADGSIPSTVARLGIDLSNGSNTELFQHELSQATHYSYDRRVPAKGTLTLSLPPPTNLPSGTDHLDVVLLYRNVRTSYYRLATGNSSVDSHSPEVEVARSTYATNP